MLRRYCPPTSNNAFVICPSEQTRTASISTSNTLSVVDHRFLQPREHRRRLLRVALLEVLQALQLALLFFLGRAGEFDVIGHRLAVRVAEGVDADDRILAGVLQVLVVQ